MSKTVHDFLRERLLAKAGIFELLPPAPTLDEVAKIQSCPQFEQYRKNRMIMGFFRYGSLADQIGKSKYDNVGSIARRLALYNKDRNREHLVDIANLAMIEFATHPDYPFNAVDDGEHTARRE